MSVIYCKTEQVVHPYFIESLGVHIGSSQELAYVFYNYPLLVMDGFIDLNLVEFIRDELNMGYTALKMERWMKSPENQDELIFIYLQECDYYTSVEINRLRQTVTSYRKLPRLEYEKKKADYLFGFGQYGKAMAGYDRILETVSLQKPEKNDDAFVSKVWNNLGACYARVFRFDKAMEAYDRAYGKKKDMAILEKIYHLSKIKPDLVLKERYQSIITEELKTTWDKDFEAAKDKAEHSEGLENIEKLFAKDPIKRMEGASVMVDKWKQEYRGMA